MRKLIILALIIVSTQIAVIVWIVRDPETKISSVSVDGNYSFFIAGHVYGDPQGTNLGFYPPFKSSLSKLQSSEHPVEFGILTGDTVRKSNAISRLEVRNEILNLGIPMATAIGNHDRRPVNLQFGPWRTYYKFNAGEDLFIVLDPNLKNWNIKGKQLTFLKRSLNEGKSARNIFIFFHQVLWWQPENQFRCVDLNSREGRSKKINFFNDVLPLFGDLEQQVYMFSGDVGAGPNDLPSYHKDGNINFIASGMGGGNGNFLVARVGDKVEFELVWVNNVEDAPTDELQETILKNKLRIEDYKLSCD